MAGVKVDLSLSMRLIARLAIAISGRPWSLHSCSVLYYSPRHVLNWRLGELRKPAVASLALVEFAQNLAVAHSRLQGLELRQDWMLGIG